MGLRERKKEHTRIDLIRIALELFKENGCEATTVDDIVDRAMVSRSTFFRYFGKKEDVVFAGVQAHIAQLPSLLDQALEVTNDPWAAARQVLVDNILDQVAFAPELERQCAELWLTDPVLMRHYMQHVLDVESIVAAFLAKGWGVGPDDVECQVIATAMVGVGRAVMRLGPSERRALVESLNKGYECLASGARGLNGSEPSVADLDRTRRSSRTST
jgi:AcrR family transcriptional regulator